MPQMSAIPDRLQIGNELLQRRQVGLGHEKRLLHVVSVQVFLMQGLQADRRERVLVRGVAMVGSASPRVTLADRQVFRYGA